MLLCYIHEITCHLFIYADLGATPGPSPAFRSRGAKNHKGEPHLSNAILDVCSKRGAKHEIGVQILNAGGRAPVASPHGTNLCYK